MALSSALPRCVRAAAPARRGGAGARSAPLPPGRKIKARLFYVADDGTRLTSVERDVAVRRGRRASRRARSSPRRSRRSRSRSCPRSRRARRCARCSSRERARRYVDLSRDVRTAHPGGTVNELLTVYTIVDALTANLPAVTGGADAGRRQGSRHARRPRRSAAAAREKSRRGCNKLLTMRSDNDRPTSCATPRSRRTTCRTPKARSSSRRAARK